MVLEAGKMGKQKDLSDFDNGQKGQLVNRHQGHGHPRLTDGHGERRLHDLHLQSVTWRTTTSADDVI